MGVREWAVRSLVPACLGAAATVAGAPDAQAGPWTRERGEGLLIVTLGVHQMDTPGSALSKHETAVYAEYGLLDGLTLVGRTGWQMLEEQAEGGARSAEGMGGAEAGLRLRLLARDRWVVSAQGLTTFRVEGETWNNVPYGEGGGDLEGRLMAGRSIGETGFASAQIAWRDRGNLPGGEIRFDTGAGIRVTGPWQLHAKTYSVWSQGNTTGELQSYRGHRAEFALVRDLGERNAASIAVLRTVGARNLATETAVLAGVWRRF
jgi:protein XagA